MDEQNLITAKLIEVDVIRAYDSPNDKNLKNVLESVKKVMNEDGSYNIEIISYLKSKGMGLVWGKTETDVGSQSRVGVHYKDAVYEISQD